MGKIGRYLQLLFCVKLNRRALIHHIYAFRPTILVLSSKAQISVAGQFFFNRQWDAARQMQNRSAGSLYVADGASLKVDDFSCCAGCRITVNEGAELTLKSGSLNYDSVIECFDHISIGAHCSISERVIIRDSNNHMIDRDGYRKSAPIQIGDHVWIGMGAMILSGVTIGDGAVIAAGALVNRDVPAHAMVAGVPARIIRENVEWN